MTLGKSAEAQFAFFLSHPDQLADEERRFTLNSSDFVRINPNTRTCPIFRSRMDADLTKKIYQNVPVLVQEATKEKEENNPWGISFSTMFHMSNDSYLFKNSEFQNSLPLYEAKMIHQFDHRWAGYRFDENGNPIITDIDLLEKQSPNYSTQPRYWVEKRQVLARIANVPNAICKAYADNDESAMLKALANWINAGRKIAALETDKQVRQTIIKLGGSFFEALPENSSKWIDEKMRAEAMNYESLTYDNLQDLRETDDIWESMDRIMDERSPRWLMGFRNICRATDERTFIISVLPRAGVGHSMPLISIKNVKEAVCLFGNILSIVFDYFVRQKIGGTNMTFSYIKQFPIIPPYSYTNKDVKYIKSRIIELTYTTYNLKPWAEDLGYSGPLFTFDPDRRASLRAELDAYYAKLYGLTRDELIYILDPADIMGKKYPTETFRVLKNNEEKAYGEYRTGRIVLECYDALMQDEKISVPGFDKADEKYHEAVSYPGTDFDRIICGAALSILEVQENVSSMELLGALLLIARPNLCKPFLTTGDNTKLNQIIKNVQGLIVDSGASIKWRQCRDYLDSSRDAIHVVRSHPDQLVTKTKTFNDVKKTLPSVPNELIDLVLKVLAQINDLKQKPSEANEEQRQYVQNFERLRSAA